MKQGSIDFDSPLSRASDPRSSSAAGDFAAESGLVDSHEGAIVAAVVARPGQTSDEIAAATGLDRVAVARRMAALERKNRVRRGEQRASRITRRAGLTWWPVEGKH